MQPYNTAKIYRIVCNATAKCYIGATTLPTIQHRLKSHLAQFKSFNKGQGDFMSSFKILQSGDYIVELLENVKYVNRSEVDDIENKYINDNDCVNINRRTTCPHRLKNADAIREKTRQARTIKKTCECGSVITPQHMARHKRTMKHCRFIVTKTPTN
tara:strand:- start:362 stop:832 length:471 start_codon:yes stop_codon:yes gene_type:complete